MIRDNENVNLDYRVIFDYMYINQKLLHAVDEATVFQAALFLNNMRASTRWDMLRAIRIDIYVGPPDILVTDAGKNFVSEELVNNAKTMAIDIKEVPVEAHHSIGKAERYHATIRRAYEVISAELGLTVDSEHRLQMSLKAINDTAGPNGLKSTLLLFGTYLRLSKTSPPPASIVAHAAAIQKAMKEVRKMKAQRKISDTLATHNGPNAAEILQLSI